MGLHENRGGFIRFVPLGSGSQFAGLPPNHQQGHIASAHQSDAAVIPEFELLGPLALGMYGDPRENVGPDGTYFSQEADAKENQPGVSHAKNREFKT